MPALFDVPGWSVPSAPVSTQRQSKKRKRAASSEEQDLLRTAQANLDKLIGSLGGSDDAGGGSLKKKRKAKLDKPTSRSSHRDQRGKALHPPGKPRNQTVPVITSNEAALPRKNVKKKKAKQVVQPTNISEHSVAVQATAGLTSLQQSLKKSLDGARFRFVLASVEIYRIDLSDDLDCSMKPCTSQVVSTQSR